MLNLGPERDREEDMSNLMPKLTEHDMNDLVPEAIGRDNMSCM